MTSDATISTPRARFREMMREDILSAARQIIQKDGYAALSMRALADAVGVRAPTLYDYFASKEEVLNAVHMRGVETLGGEFQHVLETSAPGIERLVRIGVVYRRFGLTNPDLYQLMFARIDQAYSPGEEQVERSRALFEALVEHVRDAIQIGELAPNDPEEIGMALWSMTHGFVSLELIRMTEKCATSSADEQYAFLLTSILYGMAARNDEGIPARSVSIVAASSPTDVQDGIIV